MSKRFFGKYKKYRNNIIFYRYFAGKFMSKKECHIKSFFKDNLLYYKNKENLKKYYSLGEAINDLSKNTKIYKDYIRYYCFPTITDFFFNYMFLTIIGIIILIYIIFLSMISFIFIMIFINII